MTNGGEFIVGALYTVLIVFIVNGRRRRKRLRQIADTRVGEDFDSFRDAFQDTFAQDNAPDELLRAVYTWFQDRLPAIENDLPVRMSDNLDMFGIFDDDLEDVVDELLEKCHRQLPRGWKPTEPTILENVGDVARLINACPETEGIAQERLL